MELKEEIQIVGAEQLDGGVVVSFSDGRTVLYSIQLLLSFIDEARVLLDEE